MDLTELQKELIATQDRLERATQTIAELSLRLDNLLGFEAQVELSRESAHDLRTPLAVIQMQVDQLRRLDNDPDTRKRIESISQMVSLMARILTAIKKVS